MSAADPSTIDGTAALFRALAHPARLRLLRLTWSEALSGEHLARLTTLSAPTISHHLAVLREAGLVEVTQDGHQRFYRPARAALSPTLAELVRGNSPAGAPVADLAAPEAAVTDPYAERVLRAFLRDGRLLRIPAQRKKRDVVLRFLAGLFEPERDYPEREVNTILGEYHPDFFTLRRELVGLGLLTRTAGIYRRPPPEAPEGS